MKTLFYLKITILYFKNINRLLLKVSNMVGWKDSLFLLPLLLLYQLQLLMIIKKNYNSENYMLQLNPEM